MRVVVQCTASLIGLSPILVVAFLRVNTLFPLLSSLAGFSPALVSLGPLLLLLLLLLALCPADVLVFNFRFVWFDMFYFLFACLRSDSLFYRWSRSYFRTRITVFNFQVLWFNMFYFYCMSAK